MNPVSMKLAKEEDTELPQHLILYIRHLSDTPSNYARFFDALHVKRPEHPSFFHDLRSFREQEHVIKVLAHPSSSSAGSETLKTSYRETTRLFLASHFSHPWCRTTSGKIREGWNEDRLHRLLVPIWIAFRRRMMPSSEDLTAFMEEKGSQLTAPTRPENGTEQKIDSQCLSDHHQSQQERDARKATLTHGRTPARVLNAEQYVMGDDDDSDDNPEATDRQQSEDASMAAKFFVGAAAAGWLASNKRARKYLLKKLDKPAR